MTVEFWIGLEFEHSQERHALKRFLDSMQRLFREDRDSYFVLANFSLSGSQIDLAVLKHDAIVVVDLKECSEPFRATENGPWITTRTGQMIKGGDEKRNPLEQVSSYRRKWIDYLKWHQGEFLEKTKVNCLNFTHVSAFVAISPTLHPDTQVELPFLKWFSLVGLDDLPQAIYEQTSSELDFSESELRRLLGILNLRPGDQETGGVLQGRQRHSVGIAPPMPSVVIGRESDLRELKSRLGLNGRAKSPTVQILAAVKGWPGVGKTTVAAALAHDSEIIVAFRDGVLWVSLGDKPDIVAKLLEWRRALREDGSTNMRSIEQLMAELSGQLREERRLLIIDDVWHAEHAVPFLVGGKGCATLITTRFDDVARALAPTASDVYRLPVLSDEQSLDLLRTLAPEVVQRYPDESLQLARDLEGLPLALQVAGRMLHVEADRGFQVGDLLEQLREGSRLLQAEAPVDRMDLATQTTPTIAALLKKSTDLLDPEIRDCFAFLGAFAPKPAMFDIHAMSVVWGIEDAEPVARQLLDRGLIEAADDRFQMHALLVMHARSLLEE